MGLYETLKRRKKNGEKLDMKAMTEERLQQLWWDEDCTDAMIAELYDVPKKKVTNLRHTWEITPSDIIVEVFAEHFHGVVPALDEQNHPGRLSPLASMLLRKFHSLNDIDLESVRLELGRRYEVFANIRLEADFISAFEQAVQQF